MVVTSNPSPIPSAGTSVELICTVELIPAISQSDLSLLMVNAQLSRDGTPLALIGPTVTGTTFTYTIQLDSFSACDSGNYTCTVTVSLLSPSSFITGNATLSNSTRISLDDNNIIVCKIYILRLVPINLQLELCTIVLIIVIISTILIKLLLPYSD